MEALSEGTSGLINSDWHVLKFSGYMVDKDSEDKGKCETTVAVTNTHSIYKTHVHINQNNILIIISK